METKKVSIVVPVYNVEKYLQYCIDSLVSQTYLNLEIILVDDASTDNCPAICDEAARKDGRIKVIHKNNGGAASARNAGLNIVTGDYVCFVDSDDYVENKYVQRLVNVLEQENADAAVCGFWYLYRDHLEKKGLSGVYTVMNQTDYLQRFLTDWTCGLIWNKIFRKETLEDVRFTEGHKIDDEFFTYKIIMNCKRVVLFEAPLYYYRMRATSVMSASSAYEERLLLDKIEYTQERFENVTNRYPQLTQAYLEDLANSLIRFKRQSTYFPLAHSEVKKLIVKYQKRILLSNLNLKLKYSFIRAIYFEKKTKNSIEYNRQRKYEFFE